MKLKYSLISALTLSIVIPLVVGFYFLLTHVSNQYKLQVQNNLSAITQIAKLRILSSVERIKDNTALVSSRTQMRKSLRDYQENENREDLELIVKIVSDAGNSITNVDEITIYAKQGNSIASTKSATQDNLNLELTTKTFPFITLTEKNGITHLIGYDTLVLDGQLIGYIKLSVIPSFITEIVAQESSLGKTGEWVLAIKNEDGDALFVSPTRYDNKGAFNRIVPITATNAPIVTALTGSDTIMWEAVDYANNQVVASTRYIPKYDWGIVAKINSDEVFSEINNITYIFLVVLAFITLVALFIGISLSHRIAKPIEDLSYQVAKAKQDGRQKLNVKNAWTEVRLLTNGFNELLSDIHLLNKGLNQEVEDRTAELSASNYQLKYEKAKAEEATQAKSMFLANISHEVRTPLNSIHGSLQLLSRKMLDEQQKRLVDNASHSMSSLLSIINDVLDFSKVEDNSIILESEPLNFTELVQQVVLEMEVLASKRDNLLTYELAANYKEGWTGDALRVKQVLINFVSNAIKFTLGGRVTIHIDNTELNGQEHLLVKVIDTGTGMPKEVLDKMFDRFSQADSSTTRKFGGTGLGMNISLGLVNLMDGQIDVQSEVGKGTQVSTYLPLHRSEVVTTAPTLKAITTTPDMSNKTILLAEDNEINQIIFSTMLEDTNATIVLASNGEEAAKKFTECKPDIVFLDIHMPILDGIEACKLIRALNSNTPIISITANVSEEDTQHYEEVGFDDHVGKPIDLSHLFVILNKYNQP